MEIIKKVNGSEELCHFFALLRKVYIGVAARGGNGGDKNQEKNKNKRRDNNPGAEERINVKAKPEQ